MKTDFLVCLKREKRWCSLFYLGSFQSRILLQLNVPVRNADTILTFMKLLKSHLHFNNIIDLDYLPFCN